MIERRLHLTDLFSVSAIHVIMYGFFVVMLKMYANLNVGPHLIIRFIGLAFFFCSLSLAHSDRSDATSWGTSTHISTYLKLNSKHISTPSIQIKSDGEMHSVRR